MAGQPKRRATVELLEQRTAEYFEGDPTQTTLDYVACWLSNGQTLNDLAAELSHDLGFTVQREWVPTYLRKQFGEAITGEMLAKARAHASHVIAEDSLAVSDAVADSSIDVARNGLRARSRQWIAERWNPQQYGQSKAPQTAISIGTLHLHALQHAGAVVTGSLSEQAHNTMLDPTKQVQAIAAHTVSDE